MKWMEFYHPDISLPVVWRKLALELMELLLISLYFSLSHTPFWDCRVAAPRLSGEAGLAIAWATDGRNWRTTKGV